MSPTHLLLVLLVVVLVFGTKKLPEVGRGIGSAMREFKGGLSGTGNTEAPVIRTLEAPTANSQPGEQPESTVAQAQ